MSLTLSCKLAEDSAMICAALLHEIKPRIRCTSALDPTFSVAPIEPPRHGCPSPCPPTAVDASADARLTCGEGGAASHLNSERGDQRTINPVHKKVKGKGSPYSITQRRVPELIPVLYSQPACDVSHKPGGRLPLLRHHHHHKGYYQVCCLVNRGTMGVNSLPKTTTRQRCDCNSNPGPSAPKSSTLTTRLPSHPPSA